MDLVAIVGRPNVGKSTLFNKLVGSRFAIVESEPGITRDRLYGESEWNGKKFKMVDTGGFIPGETEIMDASIREQAMVAISEADVIVFVTDGRDGVTTFDEEIANILRASKKETLLIVNKCDNTIQDNYAFEFWKLGLGEPIPISSMNGHGTGDFLDALTNLVNYEPEEEQEDTRLKVTFVGRPNVGKSSLTNALLGFDRSIVTDIPGTTRDAIDSVYKYFGEEIVIIDTAGLRKRSQIKENIEMYSILRTARAIERCDVGVVLLDATRGLEDQDKKIINMLDTARKGILIAVNKWDLVEKDTFTADSFRKDFNEILPTYSYIPMQFISALTKQRIIKVIESVKEIDTRRKTRIKTSELNDVLVPLLDLSPTPSIRGRDLKINFITQVKTEPPVFAFFCNDPKLVPDNYKRFLENQIRKHWDFTGVPISLIFRKKN
ncbi:MAG: ribosome biogenesis GTPase Der [Ignavibacteria bacterium GWF2_33_9]|nr:MAG: ribosome biogenesis GTPase Der [Ignavibacteria bacterium GWF2_33_9]